MSVAAITGSGRSVSTTRIGSCLVVTAPDDLGGDALAVLEKATLEAIHGVATRAVMFELGGVQFMDTGEFMALKLIALMAQRLGSTPILVGLRPGIVAYLVQADVDIAGVEAALGLNEAFELVNVRAG